MHRLRNLAYGALTCLGRQTVSGILTASGQQFVDWTAAYRIFSQNRIGIDKLFKVSQKKVMQELTEEQMLVAHMDEQGATGKELYLSVDGSYTNSNVLKNLPDRVTVMRRIRKDTRLHKIPESSNPTGRKKCTENESRLRKKPENQIISGGKR